MIVWVKVVRMEHMVELYRGEEYVVIAKDHREEFKQGEMNNTLKAEYMVRAESKLSLTILLLYLKPAISLK